MLDVFFDSIEDSKTREAFRKLLEGLSLFPWLKGKWRFKEISVTAAVTNFKVAHGLGFIPKDAVKLSNTGSATVTFNYDKFDSTTIDITTSAATTIRVIIGSYREDT